MQWLLQAPHVPAPRRLGIAWRLSLVLSSSAPVGIGVGLSVAAFLALAGLGAAADGVDRTACASAQMLNTTLAGRTEMLASSFHATLN